MFYFKKSLGQNFLKDENKAKKIVEIANVKDENILEIGPGAGALTKYLYPLAKKLVLVEKDSRLIEDLENRFVNAEIYNQDFLEWDMNEIKDFKFVSNIPYNITGPILKKLVDSRDKIKEAYILVQKELAERVVAKPNDKNRSLLSVLMQLYSQVKIELQVPRGCFTPSPKVDSAVISLKFNSKEKDEHLLEVAKTLFSNKRKQILNNLMKYGTKAEISNILEELSIDYKLRAEQLTLDEIKLISKKIREIE